MPLFAITPNSSAPRAKIPPGSHFGILYSIIDLGTHEEVFQGESKIQRKVRLAWELPDERAEFDGVEKPQVIGLEMTLSLHEKATLRKYVEAIIGKSLDEDAAAKFDLETLLGSCSLLNVIEYKRQDGAMGTKVKGCSALMKGMTARAAQNPATVYSISEGLNAVFGDLPLWLQARIALSREFRNWAKSEEWMKRPEVSNWLQSSKSGTSWLKKYSELNAKDESQDDIPF